MSSGLLPGNSTAWERAVADAMPVSTLAVSAIGSMRRIKYQSPRPSMLPFLVWEYGLGELTPYVPNLYNLIDEGVHWQRLRGTVSAVAIGLAWIGYSATIEPAWWGRRWWNSFQLRFGALPVRDAPDLERIEGIAKLSVPKRSQLRRGVFGYDVEAAQANHSCWNHAMWNFESGIDATPDGTLWSFGRALDFEHRVSPVEAMAIGNWIIPTDDLGLRWSAIEVPWENVDFLWAGDAETQRQSVMSGWFNGRSIWLRLSDESGTVIGYRRCRAVHQVTQVFSGPYEVNGIRFAPSPVGVRTYIEAMTQFGDANGVTCSEIALLVGASIADGTKPGTLWLEPDGLSGGEVIAVKYVDRPLRRTVREKFKFVLRFDNPPNPALRLMRVQNAQYLPLLDAMELIPVAN